MKKFYSRKKRHFRGRKTKVNHQVVTHPNYIVGEDQNHYYSFGLTHSDRKGKKHKNYRLVHNPKEKDDSVAYLRKQMEIADKSSFTSRFKNYHMSKKDDDYVDTLIEKMKRSKFHQ